MGCAEVGEPRALPDEGFEAGVVEERFDDVGVGYVELLEDGEVGDQPDGVGDRVEVEEVADVSVASNVNAQAAS